HGANEFIELKEQNVGEIRGVLSFREINGNPTEDVVAGVDRFKGDGTLPNIEKVIAFKRIVACTTGGEGQLGINEVHAIIRVMPGASRKNIEIHLRPGT